MDHHSEMESHYAAGLERQDKRLLMEAAMVALVAEFVGAITGLRPPLERRLFPQQHEPALNRLCDGAVQVVKECEAQQEYRKDMSTPGDEATKIVREFEGIFGSLTATEREWLAQQITNAVIGHVREPASQ